MSVWRLCGVVFVGVFALLGCGGSDTGVGGPSLTNQYAGTFQGSYVNSQGQIGTVSCVISSTGAITGTDTDTATGTPTTLAGSVDSSGDVTLTVGTDATTGTLTTVSSTTPTAAMSVTDSASSSTNFMLVVNPVAITGGVTYEGDYAGTLIDFTNSTTEVLALNISTTGVVTGYEVNDDSGTPVVGTINGTISTGGSGSGTLSWTVAASGTTIETAQGTITLSGTNLSGVLTATTGASGTGGNVAIDFQAPLVLPASSSAKAHRQQK